jgi:hypothetical protein
LRRAQRILLVLRVELGDDLASLEDIADIHEPLGHASVDAEGEVDLVLGANLARQRHDLTLRVAHDGEGPNRPDLRGEGRFPVAAHERHDDQACCCDLTFEHREWFLRFDERGRAASPSYGAKLSRALCGWVVEPKKPTEPCCHW